mgnify:CR=1 FL=1
MNEMIEHIKNITKNPPARDILEGRTISKVRYQTDREMDNCDWPCRALVLILDNGASITVSTDSEGNGPGALLYSNKNERDTFGSVMAIKQQLKNG